MRWPFFAETGGAAHLGSGPRLERRMTRVSPRAVEASVSHAATKGITLKIGSALKKIAIFSIGIGSVAAGGMLTVISTAASYGVCVTNEYLWDGG